MSKQKEANDLELFRVLHDSLMRNKNTRDIVIDICEKYITNDDKDDTPEIYGESQDPNGPMIDIRIPDLDEGDDGDLFHEDDKKIATKIARVESPEKVSVRATLYGSNELQTNTSATNPIVLTDEEKDSFSKPIVLMDEEHDHVHSKGRNKSTTFQKILVRTKAARMRHTRKTSCVKTAHSLSNAKAKSATASQRTSSAVSELHRAKEVSPDCAIKKKHSKRQFTIADIVDKNAFDGTLKKTSLSDPIVLLDEDNDSTHSDDSAKSVMCEKAQRVKAPMSVTSTPVKSKMVKKRHAIKKWRVKEAVSMPRARSGSPREPVHVNKMKTHSRSSEPFRVEQNKSNEIESDFFKVPTWLKETEGHPREGSSQWYMWMYHRARRGNIKGFPELRKYWDKPKYWFLTMSYSQQKYETANGLPHN